MDKPAIFLDFDGVICDSINECFVSSWLAYERNERDEHTHVRLEDYRLFRRYRPFIRTGGDYVLLQRCIAAGIHLVSQADFDLQHESVGTEKMDSYHNRFYDAREELLQSERSFWLSLNTIYPVIKDVLEKAAESAWILTTKKADFAYEIAAANGMYWNRERIICSGNRRKVDIISEIIGPSSAAAIFIDDQIDHFKDVGDARITCMLAAWGYIVPDWLSSGVDVIDEGGFVGLMEQHA